jgi:hypothetical protein
MRKLVVGGERILAQALDRVGTALRPDRLSREALVPIYGLAEAVLADTRTPIGRGPSLLGVDKDSLAAGAVQPVDGGDGSGEVA